MTKNTLQLSPDHLSLVKQLLQQFVPNHEVRAFGSRVKHTAKPFSDLDLVIMTEAPLPLTTLADLADAFSDSLLPIKVDVLDWSRIDEAFRQLIWQESVLIQSKL